MTVRTTQFSYDDHWLKRKNNTNATWRDIMEAGIIAIENAKGIKPKERKPDPEAIPEKEPQRILDNEIPEEVVSIPEPEPEEQETHYYLQIEPQNSVVEREFDALIDEVDKIDLTSRKVWKPLPMDEIPIETIFRIRDNNVVVVLNDFNKFEKKSSIQLRDGKQCVMVRAIKRNAVTKR